MKNNKKNTEYRQANHFCSEKIQRHIEIVGMEDNMIYGKVLITFDIVNKNDD